jgi:hypothetical protein
MSKKRGSRMSGCFARGWVSFVCAGFTGLLLVGALVTATLASKHCLFAPRPDINYSPTSRSTPDINPNAVFSQPTSGAENESTFATDEQQFEKRWAAFEQINRDIADMENHVHERKLLAELFASWDYQGEMERFPSWISSIDLTRLPIEDPELLHATLGEIGKCLGMMLQPEAWIKSFSGLEYRQSSNIEVCLRVLTSGSFFVSSGWKRSIPAREAISEILSSTLLQGRSLGLSLLSMTSLEWLLRAVSPTPTALGMISSNLIDQPFGDEALESSLFARLIQWPMSEVSDIAQAALTTNRGGALKGLADVWLDANDNDSQWVDASWRSADARRTLLQWLLQAFKANQSGNAIFYVISVCRSSLDEAAAAELVRVLLGRSDSSWAKGMGLVLLRHSDEPRARKLTLEWLHSDDSLTRGAACVGVGAFAWSEEQAAEIARTLSEIAESTRELPDTRFIAIIHLWGLEDAPFPVLRRTLCNLLKTPGSLTGLWEAVWRSMCRLSQEGVATQFPLLLEEITDDENRSGLLFGIALISPRLAVSRIESMLAEGTLSIKTTNVYRILGAAVCMEPSLASRTTAIRAQFALKPKPWLDELMSGRIVDRQQPESQAIEFAQLLAKK